MRNLAINVAHNEGRRKGSSSTSSEAITRGLVFWYKSSDYVVKLLLSFDARLCQVGLPGEGATKYPRTRIDNSHVRIAKLLILCNFVSVVLSVVAIFVDAPQGFLSEICISPSSNVILYVSKVPKGSLYARMLSHKLLLNLGIEKGALTSVDSIFSVKSLLQIRFKI